MTTQEKIFNRAISEGGAVIRNGLETAVINGGFKVVHRPDRKRQYRVYNTNELPDDYVEISQEWLLILLDKAPNWGGLSHRIREANMAKSFTAYIEQISSLRHDYLP